MPSSRDDTVALVRDAACPLRGAARELDALLDMIGGCRFVLLGEATHGTAEFYRERARITRRLVEEKGFTAVAVGGMRVTMSPGATDSRFASRTPSTTPPSTPGCFVVNERSPLTTASGSDVTLPPPSPAS